MNPEIAGLKACATFVGVVGQVCRLAVRVVAQLFRPAVIGAFVLLLGSPAGAQTPTETVETDPIRCWWRTSASAVRVGEPFLVVLTCTVVETDAVTVVPNQAELDPNAMQLPPFDVIGGAKASDLRTADHRFFQYQYRLRLVSEEMFGQDVPLPDLKISYRVRSRVDADAVEGRDQIYLLPEASVRVLSLVPPDATDIRDASFDTFDIIDRRLSRANVLRLVGGVLIGFAALAGLVAVVRLASGARAKTPAPRSLVSDRAILREVGRELAAIQHARRDGGWTPEMVARLLTSLRIISGYALGLPATALVGRPSGGDGAPATAGQLTLRGRGASWGSSREVTVPGWVTPNVIAQQLGRLPMPSGPRPAKPRNVEVLEALESAMAKLTVAHYGREGASGSIDEAAPDEALALASSSLRRLKMEQAWPIRKLQALRFPKGGQARRVWSR